MEDTVGSERAVHFLAKAVMDIAEGRRGIVGHFAGHVCADAVSDVELGDGGSDGFDDAGAVGAGDEVFFDGEVEFALFRSVLYFVEERGGGVWVGRKEEVPGR